MNPDPHLERLVNLTLALLAAAEHGDGTISSSDIHRTVDAYQDLSTDAFRSTFRRDREALRRAGVPIEPIRQDGQATRFRLLPDNYALDEVNFTEAEAAVLGLAADISQRGASANVNRTGWTKLAAAGLSRDLRDVGVARGGDDLAQLAPEALDALLKATAKKRHISFTYTPNPAAPHQRRHMDPWGLVTLKSRIYLVGFDTDRDAVRCFRIPRINQINVGDAAAHPRPQDVDLAAVVAETLDDYAGRVTVTFSSQPDKGYHLTRGAQCTHNSPDGTRTWIIEDADRRWVVGELAGNAPGVIALDPPDIRTEVIARLEQACGTAYDPVFADLEPRALELERVKRRSGASDTAVGKGSAGTREGVVELVRMLNLVPYFEAHPERSAMEAARDLGSTPQQIMEDLHRLWCCGLPGLMPDNLIDLEPSYSKVQINNNQGMNRALRLTRTEAATLLLTLELLEQSPGLHDVQAITSAAQKLRELTGVVLDAVVDVDGTTGVGPEDRELASLIRTALDQGIKLMFDYTGASADTPTTRVISPARMMTHQGHSYLVGYVEDKKAHRWFRTDRISAAKLIDEPSQPHLRELGALGDDPFTFGDSPIAIVALRPENGWLLDAFPLTLIPEATSATGELYAYMKIGNAEWCSRFAVFHADALRVCGPPELAQKVADHARAGLRAYDRQTEQPGRV